MSEEQGQVTTPAQTGAETTVTPIVNVDGSFAEGWINSLDEDVRADKGLGSFKSVKDLAKSYVNAHKMIGKDKIAVPNEKSTPSEWEAYFEAGGRPKTVADYKLDYPKDMPVPEEPELKKGYIELAHKAGLSQKQTQALYEYYNNIVKQSVAKQEQDEQLEKSESEEKLHTLWGNAYDQRVHFGNVAVHEGSDGDADFEARLIEKFGNDPDFIRYSSNLGNKFAEHKTISQNIPTPGDIQSQIDKLQHDPLYTHGTKQERMRIADQIVRLRSSMETQKR